MNNSPSDEGIIHSDADRDFEDHIVMMHKEIVKDTRVPVDNLVVEDTLVALGTLLQKIFVLVSSTPVDIPAWF